MMYTKVSDKRGYANSVDPSQTAPEQGLHNNCHSTKYFKEQLHTSKL